MSRIAAVVALVALPAIGIAQLAIYAANHAGMPGHALARAVVPATFEGPLESEPPVRPTPTVVNEAPRSGALVLAPRDTAAAGATQRGTTVAQLPVPNRARIAALVKEHHADIARGERKAMYVVVVLDAADKYVWSTPSAGTVGIEVGADSRTFTELAAHHMRYRQELLGGYDPGTSSPLYVVDGVPILRGAAAGIGSIDIANIEVIRGDAASKLYGSDAAKGVISITTNPPQRRVQTRDTALTGGRGVRGNNPLSTAGRQASDTSATPRRYIVGSAVGSSGGNGARAEVNATTYMQPPGNGNSGIQGLPSSNVAAADIYHFGPTEITAGPLSVIAVYLTPGSTWRR